MIGNGYSFQKHNLATIDWLNSDLESRTVFEGSLWSVKASSEPRSNARPDSDCVWFEADWTQNKLWKHLQGTSFVILSPLSIGFCHEITSKWRVYYNFNTCIEIIADILAPNLARYVFCDDYSTHFLFQLKLSVTSVDWVMIHGRVVMQSGVPLYPQSEYSI